MILSNGFSQVAEQELQGLFQPFGPIEAVNITRDPSGNSLGSGSVQFSTIADATKAMQHYNGALIAGTTLRVTLASISIPSLMSSMGGLPGGADANAMMMMMASMQAGNGMSGGHVGSGFGPVPGMPPGPPQAPVSGSAAGIGEFVS